MSKYIQRYVNTCELCQRNKARQTKPPRLLQSLEIPEGRWIDVTMDFMVALPKTAAGKDAIMVIVDRLTKRAKFIATNTAATAEETAALLLVREVIGHRRRKKKLQYRIWWLGEPREDATWEPVENLNQIPGLIDNYWDSKKKQSAASK
ncbi:unnamed protein product [Phytophthora fragariaefolia]|uniref:Unnamed protein product n=1 Tax=Phytophthora fragariaefolia TaxID=1490495 RepID=A0A9W6YD16_9STRA|nr:unnamed protein product [Phytophthora fragariaefolia]